LTKTADERPSVWVGHVLLFVADLARAKAFFLGIGMRDAEPDASVGVLELRGGTHLLLLPSTSPIVPGTRAPFDLMVDDLDAARIAFRERGLNPSPIQTNPTHRFFLLREPSGYDVVVNSSHATGLPV
jgi:catechol 2,3-dioxygenase-like lactoylglutathione lyase family enzyme